MSLVLDTGVLGTLCHPREVVSRPVATWLVGVLTAGELDVYLPAIVEYELRRKLNHLVAVGKASSRSLHRLDDYCDLLEYLDLTRTVLQDAAQLWATARLRGFPTAADAAIDADVILAAQALAVGGTVVTMNTRHLERFVTAKKWEDLAGA